MKWVIFTGTWCLTNKEVENDVRNAVREVFSRGDGLVTGGATGVDYFAIDESITCNPDCTRIRIYLPASLDLYIKDYYKNWKHAPIVDQDIEKLETLLRYIKEKNPASFFESHKDETDILQEDYDLRHDEEIRFSDEVYAFQVNNSTGTQDTIDKSIQAGLPVALHKKYSI